MIKRGAPLSMALLLAVLVVAGTARPALAVRPESTTFQLAGAEVLADWAGFQVIDHYDATVIQTLYFDQDGQVVEIHQVINGTDTYTNSVTGEAISQGSHFMVHFDTDTRLNSSAGMKYRLMVPGFGHLLLEVGRSVYDVDAGTFVFVARAPPARRG